MNACCAYARSQADQPKVWRGCLRRSPRYSIIDSHGAFILINIPFALEEIRRVVEVYNVPPSVEGSFRRAEDKQVVMPESLIES